MQEAKNHRVEILPLTNERVSVTKKNARTRIDGDDDELVTIGDINLEKVRTTYRKADAKKIKMTGKKEGMHSMLIIVIVLKYSFAVK